jgi:hypothetical protein
MTTTRTVVMTAALALAAPLGPLAAPAHGRIIIPPRRFTFKIDPQAPLKDLLPPPPDATAPLPPWLVREWSQVPQVFFQKPAGIERKAPPQPRSDEERAERVKAVLKAMDDAAEQTAHVIAKINHLNGKGADQFLKALLESRQDLTGLPFVMGDACRQGKSARQAFFREVNAVRVVQTMRDLAKPEGALGIKDDEATAFWERYEKVTDGKVKDGEAKRVAPTEEEALARTAALMQMLAPEDPALRRGLVKYLAGLKHAEATRALARLAVFSFDESVRRSAVDALRDRSKADSADVLLAGLQYPWPAVADNAGAAMTRLGRKDLVPRLVASLDEPEPRAPAEREVNGKKTLAVRELVRLNHHQNCLLCHAPGNTPDVELNAMGRSTNIVTGPVPSPGQPFNSPSRGYDPNASPDVLVRADVTYLRQDFSLLQAVKDADPWPEMQRFDYLVRTRAVTAEEARQYRQWLQEQGPGYLAPSHRAAVTALRALTGRDAPEPTAKAWRKVLEE